MTHVVPVESWHFSSINVQSAQEAELEMVLDAMHIAMGFVDQNRDYNGTILDGAEVLAVAGIHDMGDHGEAWTFLARGIEGRMTPVIRTVFRYMLKFSLTGKPIYANVDPGHSEAVRWATILGFRQTGKADIWCFTRTVRQQS